MRRCAQASIRENSADHQLCLSPHSFWAIILLNKEERCIGRVGIAGSSVIGIVHPDRVRSVVQANGAVYALHVLQQEKNLEDYFHASIKYQRWIKHTAATATTVNERKNALWQTGCPVPFAARARAHPGLWCRSLCRLAVCQRGRSFQRPAVYHASGF